MRNNVIANKESKRRKNIRLYSINKLPINSINQNELTKKQKKNDERKKTRTIDEQEE